MNGYPNTSFHKIQPTDSAEEPTIRCTGAAGRADSEIKIVRRGPVNGGVRWLLMAVFDELIAIDWPPEFIVEYADGAKENLLRGDGVALQPPSDDPEGCGILSAILPHKHPQNQKQVGRHVRFTELRAIYTIDGRQLWPTA